MSKVNTPLFFDTITAIATPPGRGGVGIIRISGPLASAVSEGILKKKLNHREVYVGGFFNASNELIDDGIALFFEAPRSFTGENVLELQGHGGPVVLDMLLQRIIQLGARLAKPGEFSERAFLNDKIDLAQAEAIADLIDASSEQAARSAVKSLTGEFSKKISELIESLIHLRMYVEAAIDFPEEEIDFLSDKHINDSLAHIQTSLKRVMDSAKQGRLLRDGMTVVIAGEPNVGKSSLLNALSGEESAIVTDIAGTTRDVLRETINIDGLPLHIVDTAGLRESKDIVEQEGIARARKAIARADEILFVMTAEDSRSIEELINQQLGDLISDAHAVTVIKNKIDLVNELPRVNEKKSQKIIYLSAKKQEGIDLLKKHLKAKIGYENGSENVFIARRRHVEALLLAVKHLDEGVRQLKEYKAGEFLAEELKLAQSALGEITGVFTSDDLLGRIFSSFCIGK